MLIPTNRGGEKLIFQGHVYNRQGKQIDNGHMYWRCELYGRPKKNCPGWAKTNKDLGNPRITRAHNHPQSAARVEVLQIKQSIREGALTSTSGPSAIIKQKLAGISEEAKVFIFYIVYDNSASKTYNLFFVISS
jgi:hypothetical protein